MKPKTLHIDPDFEADLRSSVDRAEVMLERILSDAAGHVDVRWKSGEAESTGDRTVWLTLSDSGITKSYQFFEWEFQEDLHVRRKLRELWDEVLAERIKIQRERVLQSLAESGGE